MTKHRFVTAATVRLELSEGDWIEVKERLSYGEQQRLTGMAVGRAGDGGIHLDYARYEIERLATWLVDWSFRDDQDKPVALSKKAIENLDPDTADEIDAALNAHIEARGNPQTPGETRPG